MGPDVTPLSSSGGTSLIQKHGMLALYQVSDVLL